MDNLTLQEEPFGILNLEELEHTEYSYYNLLDAWDVFAKTTELGIIGASVLACITLIYVITKFDYLQTRPNLYILHYAICSAIFYILQPLYELIYDLEIFEIVRSEVLCVCYEIDNIMLVLNFSFGTILAADWLIVLLNVSWVEKYGQIQKYVILVMYFAHAVQFALALIPCFGELRLLRGEVSMLEYFVLAVTVLAINSYTFFKKPSEECVKYRYSLTISNYVVLSWLPMFISYFVILFILKFSNNYITSVIAISFETFLKYVISSIPIVSAFRLDSLNSDFSKAFKAIFIRNARKYQQDNLDEDDESMLIDNERGQGHTDPVLV